MTTKTTTYRLLKTLPSRPGYGTNYQTSSVDEREIEFSRHRSLEAAERAKSKAEADHNGYATFRIVED